MKFTALLLAAYIMLLTGVTCADRDLHHLQAGNVLAQSEQGHGDSGCVGCSPFCSCSCCASPRITWPEPILFTVNDLPGTSVPDIKGTFHFSEYYSIWQPPKLSKSI
jgi:hypothetical protein